jgi:uncharacterized membrane protein
MSETAAPPVPVIPPPAPLRRSWTLAVVVAIVMVLFALVGVGLTAANLEFAKSYWICLVPVYGLLCIATAWMRVRAGAAFDYTQVYRQFFHWLGVGVALGLEFYIRASGQETDNAAALNSLLLLSLGCFLAGVHLETLFLLVGLLLAALLAVIDKAAQYQWAIFLGGGVAIVVILILHRRFGRASGSHASPA